MARRGKRRVQPQSRPAPARATDPASAGPPAAPPQAMPTANMPPAIGMDEQQYARGGSVTGDREHAVLRSMAGAPRTGYLKGYADGGYVDPMGYVPDPVRAPPPRPSYYDEANLIGRREPTISPMYGAMAETGYANGGAVRGYQEGGEVEEETRRRAMEEEAARAAAEQARARDIERAPVGMPTGYGGGEQAAAPQPRGHSFSDVLDYLHDSVFGRAQAAEAPSAPSAPSAPPVTGYAGPAATAGAGGYGGELVSGPPVRPQSAFDAARAAGTIDPQGEPLPGRPLSLTSDAPPTISGQPGTPAWPGTPAGSDLGRIEREIAERPRADPTKMGTFERLIALPGELATRGYDAVRRQMAENRMFTGASLGPNVGDRPVGAHIQEGIRNLLQGDRPYTPEQATNVLKEIHNDPQADHNPMVQKTFDSLKTLDEKAAFSQTLRDPFNGYLGIGQAALEHGRLDVAIKAIEQAHNLLPNNMKLNITQDKDGSFIATVRPEIGGGGAGQAYSIRMNNAGGLYDLLTKHMQFDAVGKNGIQNALEQAAKATQPAAPAPGLASGDRLLTGTPAAEGARIDERNQRLGYPATGDVDRSGIPYAGGPTDTRISRGLSPSGLPTAASDARAGGTDVTRREADMRRSGAYRVGDYAPGMDRAPPASVRPAGGGSEGGDPWALQAPQTSAAPVGRVTAAPIASLGREAPAQQPGVAWQPPRRPSDQEVQETEARQRFIDRVHGRPSQTAEVLTPDQALQRQAAAAAPAAPAAAAAPADENVAQIKNDADYAKLPKGARFVGPDGKVRIKP
jgi:hypothetical protein